MSADADYVSTLSTCIGYRCDVAMLDRGLAVLSLRSGRTEAQRRAPETRSEHKHASSGSQLRLGFSLTVLILLIEVAGGVLAHSLALFSDAGHMLTDVIALGLAWFAAAQAERPANARSTFGYHRVGIVTAFLNGLTLVAIALVIGFEAYHRLMHPEDVQPGIMIAAAIVALAINVVIVRTLHAGHEHNLNVRAALLHVIGDIGASAAVVVGAVLILITGATWVDPILSLLIALVIAAGSVRLVREALNILLEAVPKGLSVPSVARDIKAVAGVRDVHDLHVWTISSGMHALSCHAIIDDIPPSASARILDRLGSMLHEKYRIDHTTIQFETVNHDRHEGFCVCQPSSCDTLYCELRQVPSDKHEVAHDGHEHPHA